VNALKKKLDRLLEEYLLNLEDNIFGNEVIENKNNDIKTTQDN
jgi:hypothetical protein